MHKQEYPTKRSKQKAPSGVKSGVARKRKRLARTLERNTTDPLTPKKTQLHRKAVRKTGVYQCSQYIPKTYSSYSAARYLILSRNRNQVATVGNFETRRYEEKGRRCECIYNFPRSRKHVSKRRKCYAHS